MRQAEDRAYRLGQKRDVLALVPVIPGTIDEGVLALQENQAHERGGGHRGCEIGLAGCRP